MTAVQLDRCRGERDGCEPLAPSPVPYGLVWTWIGSIGREPPDGSMGVVD
ncbi:hypothetical protein [Halovivax cerinus]|uniref:Uncharacterized protein n=1 Tax=Halovivax cerinus TaxID=1487865 RepID=A0ABD5NRN1_9EURY|nr:hypothetical protein [Halovivax cerinus]